MQSWNQGQLYANLQAELRERNEHLGRSSTRTALWADIATDGMSRDFQQAGRSKQEAAALSLLQCVSDRSRGHILLFPMVLRRDTHSIFTEVEGKNRYLSASDWLEFSQSTPAHRTHAPWNHPWGFSWDLEKPNVESMLNLPLQFLHLCVLSWGAIALTSRCRN